MDDGSNRSGNKLSQQTRKHVERPIATHQTSFATHFHSAKRSAKAETTTSRSRQETLVSSINENLSEIEGGGGGNPTVPVSQKFRKLFEVDLMGAATSLLKLLCAVDTFPPGLYGGPALREAVRRYEKLWLPMIAEYEKKKITMRNRIQVEAEQRQALSDVKWLWEGIQIPGDDSWQFRAKQKYGPLVPPLDIAWVWYLHRLDPVAYHDCCQNYFGQTIDAGRGAAEDGGSVIAALAFDSGHHRSSALTRVIWGALYLREPFYPPVDRQRQITEINGDLLDLDATEGKDMDGTKRNSLVQRLASHKEKADFMTALEFDFESAAETQRRFFEQIMSRWKMYSSKVWLVEAVKRYHNWLQVQADLLESDPARAGQLVAPMDIALMWHAHMACNWAYEKECRTVLELDGLIPHDPVTSDARDSSNISQRVQITKDVWSQIAANDNTVGSLTRKGAPMAFAPTRHTICEVLCHSEARKEIWGQSERAGFEKMYQNWWVEGEYTASRCSCSSFWLRVVFLLLWFIAGILISYYTETCETTVTNNDEVVECTDYSAYILWPALVLGIICFRPFFTTCCLNLWGYKRFQAAMGGWDLPHSSTHPFWDFPSKWKLPFWIAPHREHYGEDPSRLRWWCPHVTCVLVLVVVFFVAFFVPPVSDALIGAAREVVDFVIYCANQLASKLSGVFESL